MKKRFLIGIIVLVVALAFYYFSFGRITSEESLQDIPGKITTPMMNAEDKQIETAENPTATFEGVEGRSTSGSATIVTTTEGTFIRLDDDFASSASAPDNRVYLGNADGHQLEISKLKAPKGGQNFPVPDNVDVSAYTHIWIHCKAFNTTYGVAKIVR